MSLWCVWRTFEHSRYLYESVNFLKNFIYFFNLYINLYVATKASVEF